MRALYLFSVWIHILAATIWIGGMFFLILVVVPWLRGGGQRQAGALLRETASRFRTIAWACFAILLLTGTFNLWVRGVRFGDFANPDWLASPFGSTVLAKLVVFAIVLAMSARHDFVIGPRATVAIERDPLSAQAQKLRRQASLHGRTNALLALVLVALAVMLVRGSLW